MEELPGASAAVVASHQRAVIPTVDVDGPDSACPQCGSEIASATICPGCGWDRTTAVGQRPRHSLLGFTVAGGWRVLAYGAVAALLVLGHMRYQRTGPGSDLAETLRWITIGDRGRSAELVTIHRAHEIATATARHLLHEVEPVDFEGAWSELLAPHATINVRGWMPLLFVLADSELAPAAVRELFEVRAVDGWGRPYRTVTRLLDRTSQATSDPQVEHDLELGLLRSFFQRAEPELGDGDWLRLELVSAGGDGAFDSSDDVRLISYMPANITVRLGGSAADTRSHLERAYVRGQHYFRIEGSRWDLIDARLLAEFRLETFALR